ncbi:hypothetical protein F9278_41015 [Streptomyces phaeolivaceus]|uniref:Uncharacterized protein n=1 Tax=Streptomyces phaeolivaceus TaxID=2653200 RepID=A0A5P8KDW5_9ACTN|nr:hypothetical protein [Streptomyces phaeolivaceus]QFR01514.1 hypothetical protein F9278_41015 [Streptomyces phaeolivaceus]
MRVVRGRGITPAREENLWKPAETRVVGGTIKPLTAEKVAEAIVKGIEQGRFTICPDTGTRALVRLGSVLMPLPKREFDRRVRAVQRSTRPVRRSTPGA